jgi:hypothetical protein
LSLWELKLTPSLGGEADLLQTLTVQPGVQTGAEGVGGFYVRGGSSDQNLVLLDDVPVYHPFHAWGVYSIFNTAAIQRASFYKDGFPSRYAGRLSSVLDVRTRDGNSKQFGFENEVGLVSAKTLLEGPIFKDKASFIVSARRALLDFYSEPYFRSVRQSEGIDGTIKYRFYDLNGKLNVTPDARNKLFFTYYQGHDGYDDFQNIQKISLDTQAVFNSTQIQGWGNTILALRWNRLWSSKLFSNTTLTFSEFAYESKTQSSHDIFQNSNPLLQQFSLSQYNSNIQDRTLKIDFDYFPASAGIVRFGGRVTQYRFQPGIVSVSEDVKSNQGLKDSLSSSLDTFWRRSQMESVEYSAYGERNFKIREQLSGTAGLFLSAFQNRGDNFLSAQPRLSLASRFAERWIIGVNFEAMTQFLHLLTATSIGLPNDIWVSTTRLVKPQRSWQVSMFAMVDLDSELKLKGQIYYKQMRNLVAFEDASTVLVNAANWESQVEQGRGSSYGLEFDIKKSFGLFEFALRYTFSKANRQFENDNAGAAYPFRYDRRHTLNLQIIRPFGKKWRLSAQWFFASGIATTLPVGTYVTVPGISLPPIQVFTFDSPNAFRLPYYHHLDLNATYRFAGKRLSHTLQFGIFNIYFRKNPIYYELREDNQYYQRFIPPLLPSFSYSVKI